MHIYSMMIRLLWSYKFENLIILVKISDCYRTPIVPGALSVSFKILILST
jgi:hypothetical protein